MIPHRPCWRFCYCNVFLEPHTPKGLAKKSSQPSHWISHTIPHLLSLCVGSLGWTNCHLMVLKGLWDVPTPCFLKTFVSQFSENPLQVGKWETLSTSGDDFAFCTWGVGCLWRDAKHPRFVAVVLKDWFKMFQFNFLVLVVRDDRLGSKKESSDHRSFVFQIVIGIKIQILIGVSRLSVNGDLRWTTLTISMQLSRKGSFPFPFPRWTECPEVHGV